MLNIMIVSLSPAKLRFLLSWIFIAFSYYKYIRIYHGHCSFSVCVYKECTFIEEKKIMSIIWPCWGTVINGLWFTNYSLVTLRMLPVLKSYLQKNVISKWLHKTTQHIYVMSQWVSTVSISLQTVSSRIMSNSLYLNWCCPPIIEHSLVLICDI